MNINALKDLISSPGWDDLISKLMERRNKAVRDLIQAPDWETARGKQILIQEIDFILKFPHDVIQEAKIKETDHAKSQ